MSKETEPTLPLMLPIFEAALFVLRDCGMRTANTAIKAALIASENVLRKYYTIAQGNHSCQIATSAEDIVARSV